MNAQTETAQGAPLAFEAVDWATAVLSSSGIDDARTDAEILLRFAVGCDRARLYAAFREKLDASHWQHYQTVVQRRALREPVAYIIGLKEFMSLEFEVNRDVLIPRPETERLADFAIEFLQETVRAGSALSQTVMDIGTGSGCLAVTIAKRVPAATVYASDISEAALVVAERNAMQHGVADRVRFRCGNLYEVFVKDGLQRKVRLIVANPPYVSRAELQELQPEIRWFEPEIAYLGGDDGLLFHRKLVMGGSHFLADGGVMVLELGCGQAENVRQMVLSNGHYKLIEILTDPAGNERAIVARRGE